MHHSSTSEKQREMIVTEIVRSRGRVHQSTGRLKQIQFAGVVSRSDGDQCREILHCSHQRLIQKRFKVAPKRKKSKALRSGERGGQAVVPPHPIHLLRYVA
ncbi:hypothetical protein TNCV_648831 [Trichonephila clavipes]|uniref:Uncharacterized protein n=1 Tax=Trichonephila clavipes TaxID=2585209 RepID=A0A8X6VPP5_TRICX|nr:hypothetical protein TNCV_648831 [Trichonephila clavipes]